MAFVSSARQNEAVLVRPSILATNGLVAGLTYINKFGYSSAITSTAAEIVSTLGGDQSYISTPSALKVSSASTADTSAGTGAQTITIEGLDSNGDIATEDITMDGQSAVATTTSFSAVFRGYVTSAGSGETNAGIIYVGDGTGTNGVPATKYLAIPAGEAQSLTTYYKVPSGKTAFLLTGFASTEDNNADSANVSFQARFNNLSQNVWRTQFKFDLLQSASNVPFAGSPPFPEITELRVIAKSSANTLSVAAEYELLLVDNA